MASMRGGPIATFSERLRADSSSIVVGFWDWWDANKSIQSWVRRVLEGLEVMVNVSVIPRRGARLGRHFRIAGRSVRSGVLVAAFCIRDAFWCRRAGHLLFEKDALNESHKSSLELVRRVLGDGDNRGCGRR